MKRSMKRLLAGLAGITLVVSALGACSTRGHDRWSESRGQEMSAKFVSRISNKLDLDAVQRVKLEALANEIQAQHKALRADGSMRQTMSTLIATERFDRAKAAELLEQKTTIVRDQGPKVLAALADFYDSLTPAQQQKVRERLASRHGRWG